MMTAEYMLSKRPVLRFTAALFFLPNKIKFLRIVAKSFRVNANSLSLPIHRLCSS